MIKVLFTGNNLRQRLRETIQNPPRDIDYITLNSIKGMPKDYKLTGSKDNLYTTRLNMLILKSIYFFRIPNLRYIKRSKLKDIDVIHSPGQLLLNNKNYIIEIDNYSVLALYNIKAFDFFLSRWIIKYYLKKKNCKKLICISEAAKNSVINTFNDKIISDKCEVVYPYILKKKVIIEKKKEIRLLFISSDFYLKGGREVIEVFDDLSKKYSFISLTIITKLKNLDQNLLDKYSKNSKIKFVEGNLPKEDLYENYYLKSDIFVMPTYQDSFGLVFLEAISSGLLVITTDMFATSEIVKDKYNGFLIESPVKYYNSDCTLNKMWFQKSISDYVFENPAKFKKVKARLKQILTNLFENKNKIDEMRKNSYQMYLNKFEDEIRKEKLNEVYVSALK